VEQRFGDQIMKCRVLNSLGWIYGELYNLERAIRYNQDGLAASLKIGDPEIIRNAEINLGIVTCSKASWARHRPSWKKSIAIPNNAANGARNG